MLGGHKKKSNKKIARGNFFRTPGVRIFIKKLQADTSNRHSLQTPQWAPAAWAVTDTLGVEITAQEVARGPTEAGVSKKAFLASQ